MAYPISVLPKFFISVNNLTAALFVELNNYFCLNFK